MNRKNRNALRMDDSNPDKYVAVLHEIRELESVLGSLDLGHTQLVPYNHTEASYRRSLAAQIQRREEWLSVTA